MDENYEWFLQQYDSLRREYGNAFLAIKNQRVLSAYLSYSEAVHETAKTEQLGTFIVQECRANGEMYQCCIASMNFS